MSNNNSILFQPLQIGNLTLNNRIVMAPLTRSRAGPSRCANELMEEYYSQRNTAGLIITEGTHISDQAIGWNNSPAIYSKEHLESWKKLVSEFKMKSDNKTPIFLQLWHCGRHSHTNFHADNRIPVGPSSISLLGVIDTPIGKLPTQTPYSLSIEEISDIIKDYKRAAEKAKEAGFHGVEIHSADGYLLDSFLQSKTNHRSDIYGGSFENRFRLLKQVIETISEIFPTDRIGVRLSPNGVTNEMGSLDYKDSFTYYFQELSKLNLAYLHVIDGLGFGFHNLGNPITLNYIRQYYKGRIIGNCGYDFKSATQAIESGNADLISFGRLFMANPDLVERFRNDWPLNKEVPLSAWYAGGAVGYTDSPFYSPNNNNNNLINSKESKINKNIGN